MFIRKKSQGRDVSVALIAALVTADVLALRIKILIALSSN